MPNVKMKLGQLISVSGDAAYFHYSIKLFGDDEHAAMSRIIEEQSGKNRMQFEMEDAARALFGKDFYIRTVTVGRGSIELLVILATAGTFYMGFSRYKNFIESAQLLKSQLQGIVRKFIPEAGEVNANFVPGPALAPVEASFASSEFDSQRHSGLTMLLLWYVILSHAALLAIALWTIYKKVLV